MENTINCIHCNAENRAIRKICWNCFQQIRNSGLALPERYKIAYELYHLDGMTYEKVGKEMGISRTRVRQLVMRYERFLRKQDETR